MVGFGSDGSRKNVSDVILNRANVYYCQQRFSSLRSLLLPKYLAHAPNLRTNTA
jgi:hypothetical protein